MRFKYIFLKALYALISLTLTTNVFAQGRKTLDNDFGIGKFKLNTDYSLYEKDLKNIWIDKKGTEFYDYIKGDIKVIFGKEINLINLAFVNNKLYTITINFGIIDMNKKLELIEFLKNKYDVPELIYPKNNLVFVARWETGKTLMHLEEYSCSSEVLACETVLFIMSKALADLLE